MRRSVHERELKPKFSNQKLVEIIHEDLRALTDDVRTAKFDAATILALLARIEATQDEMGRVMKAVVRPRAVSSERCSARWDRLSKQAPTRRSARAKRW